MSLKIRHKSSYSIKDPKPGMCNLLHPLCYSGTKEIEILWQLLMFPIKFKAHTGRLRRKQGVIATYFPGQQGPELEKDRAEPLQDQKEAIGMEMLLRA